MAVKLRAVRTAKARAGTIAQQIEIGPHVVITDESRDAGGDDLAFLPHRLTGAAVSRHLAGVGKVDGVMGQQSRSAVKAMQIKYGLPADSWPTAELLAKMRGPRAQTLLQGASAVR